MRLTNRSVSVKEIGRFSRLIDLFKFVAAIRNSRNIADVARNIWDPDNKVFGGRLNKRLTNVV